MKKILGILAGIGLAVLAVISLRRAAGGWDVGFSDVGFWWSVITFLLTVAAVSAIVGTVLHSRPES